MTPEAADNKKERPKTAGAGAKPLHRALRGFLPSVSGWFAKTFDGPSPAQRLAWPVIRRGENTLLLAPTGSGKTLAAFLSAIDDLFRTGRAGELSDGVHVLYISPLKALGNDIHKNLLEPLAGIRRRSRALPELRIAVRTGDTPQSQRAKMIRRPPHILITTPESLYLLLGSKRMAPHLQSVRTVIVDELHALCPNKRGVHLSVSLERLAARLDGSFQRIGCSATLRPLDEIARFLVGSDVRGRRRPCTIVNAGMRKNLDVRVLAPLEHFLEASNTALWASAYELLLKEISQHTTTLVFANSRYKAERTSLRLGELADEATQIGAHHGSMSREMRLETEDSLKAGRLDALVATSSLELGIDIGSVDVVYQLESPKSVTSGLQRIGRAGHLLDATSKGRILAFERDELLEAAVICRAMTAGEVDAVRIPQGCLDVLAQQIVGAVAARDWTTEELLALFRRAYPFRNLTQEQFDGVLAMLAGQHPFEAARAPRALVLWDRAAGRLSAARSSGHVSAMCVGTIPESSNYDVVISGSNKRVGAVQSEFADDCLRNGDVFVLGSSSWRMVGVRKNRLLVEAAPGATPTVPWWLGPVESRTQEVGAGIGVLRREVARRLDDPGLGKWLQREYHVGPHAAAALIEYVREQHLTAGLVPDERRLLVESWRDELGQLNVIVHSPYGSRINRTWGIAVAARAKKEFSQDWSVSAANDVLLLTRREGPAPPLHDVDARKLLDNSLRTSLTATVAGLAKDAASFGSSFRDAAVCAFQILRAWQGKRVAPWLQNHRAAELYEAAKDHPEYPVIEEVFREYVSESLDVPGLAALLERIEAGEAELVFRDVQSPSPFAHSLLVQDRYAGDHQMCRDRRAHLLRLHRQVLQEVLTSQQLAELLDARAIQRLEGKAGHRTEKYRVRNPDELAQAIRDAGDVPAAAEALQEIARGDAVAMLRPLVKARRVVGIHLPTAEVDPVRLVAADLWRQYRDAFVPTRKRGKLEVLIPQIRKGEIVGFEAESAAKSIPARWRKKTPQAEARAAVIERYLKSSGPVTQYDVINRTGWPIGQVESILDGLVAAGIAAKGVYTPDKPSPQWVNKANLEEIHRLTMGYLRRELAACAPYEVVDFVTRWQHLHPETRLRGPDGLREVIGQLQGVEIVQGFLETEILPGRVADYRPEMLDRLIAAGEVCWRRVGVGKVRRGALTLCFRKDMQWLAGMPLAFDVESEADCDIADEILKVREFFRRHGPAFFDDMLEAADVDPGAAVRAVWYLAWCGELTCDTFECVRHAGFEATLSGCYDLMHRPKNILRPSSHPCGKDTAERVVARMKRRKLDPRLGRWWPTERLTPPRQPLPEVDIIRRWTHQLLRRWGVVSKNLLAREAAAPPWGKLLPELKRLELLGKVQRGDFIDSHPGRQYGLPEAVEMLRDCRARRSDGKELGYLTGEPMFHVSFHDPANLYAKSLEMLNESGETAPRSRKLAAPAARMVIQAGQPIVLAEGKLCVRLTRPQLTHALARLKHDYAGRDATTSLKVWNDYPIETHPVAGVLQQLGFDWAKGAMQWPQPSDAREINPPPADAEEFLPYHLDPPPMEYGPDRTLRQAPEPIRPLLGRLLDVVLEELDRKNWEFQWQHDWPRATYRGMACFGVVIRQRCLHATLRAPGVTDFDKRYGRRVWVRLAGPEDVDADFRKDFRKRRTCAEAAVDAYLARRAR